VCSGCTQSSREQRTAALATPRLAQHLCQYSSLSYLLHTDDTLEWACAVYRTGAVADAASQHCGQSCKYAQKDEEKPSIQKGYKDKREGTIELLIICISRRCSSQCLDCSWVGTVKFTSMQRELREASEFLREASVSSAEDQHTSH
jgi:hypothetical protein